MIKRLSLSLALLIAFVACGSSLSGTIPDSPKVPVFITTTTPTAIPTENLTANDSNTFKVIRIIDGDTVVLSDSRRARLLGIDSPERGQCWYNDATEFARNTLLNKMAVVTDDPTQANTDRYGRKLLYLSVDGKDYSTSIARAGLAKSYVFNKKPVQKAPAIEQAVNQAKEDKLGIWSDRIGCE